MADVNVALLVSQTVTEAQSQSRIKMGRDYASFYEAWAVLRQRIEETKRDAKALEKLHSELWDAIKDGNEDEALIEMGAINASAAALCAAFAGMAAEAQRAVEEQTETRKSPAPSGAGRWHRRTLISPPCRTVGLRSCVGCGHSQVGAAI